MTYEEAIKTHSSEKFDRTWFKEKHKNDGEFHYDLIYLKHSYNLWAKLLYPDATQPIKPAAFAAKMRIDKTQGYENIFEGYN